MANLTVITMDNVTESIRGECTKWMLEIKTGTFVGTMNPVVRELLWSRLCDRMKSGGAFIIYQDKNEQGFKIETFGETKKKIEMIDGITLIKTTVRAAGK